MHDTRSSAVISGSVTGAKRGMPGCTSSKKFVRVRTR